MRRLLPALVTFCAFALYAGAQASPGNSKPTRAEGVAAFQAIAPVLHHPRCLVCHSTGNYPRQGDDLHPHIMDVRRGPHGEGATPVECSTCHQDHNLAGEHTPPGATDWRLPSPDNPMIWEGLTDIQLCRLLTDPNRNGGRNAKAIEAHMRTQLVLWAWHPGDGRTPVSLPLETFLKNVQIWTSAGAPCTER